MALLDIRANSTMAPFAWRFPSENPAGGVNGWKPPSGTGTMPAQSSLTFRGFPMPKASAQPIVGFVQSIGLRIGKRYGFYSAAFYPGPSALAPTVISTAPNNGPAAGGTVVVVTGTNFIGATSVTFGGVSVTAFAVLSATQIRVVTQPHAAGAVDVAVTTAAGTGTGLGVYTYT